MLIVALAGMMALLLIRQIQQDLATTRNDLKIALPEGLIPNPAYHALKIAVAGDLHVEDGPAALAALSAVVDQIRAARPDLVLLLGDYAPGVWPWQDIDGLRRAVAQRLAALKDVPKIAVLGNHDTWTDADGWQQAFGQRGIVTLENETIAIETRVGPVCVRGLGDRISWRLRYVPFPPDCGSALRITISHDPAAAFLPEVGGLVFAAHTHCGQVSFPWLGPLWVPTPAPAAAHCGLYEDDRRVLWVTSGVGTSILPIRFGAPSQWDLVTLEGRGPRHE